MNLWPNLKLCPSLGLDFLQCRAGLELNQCERAILAVYLKDGQLGDDHRYAAGTGEWQRAFLDNFRVTLLVCVVGTDYDLASVGKYGGWRTFVLSGEETRSIAPPIPESQRRCSVFRLTLHELSGDDPVG